jgi:hypothetical protein
MRTRVENERSPPEPAAGPKLKEATSGSGFLSMKSVSEGRVDLGEVAGAP